MVVGQAVDIQITVHNYGPAPRADFPLSVFVDQQRVAATTANIPAAASTTVTQSLRIRTSGSHVITVRTPPDGISRDEQFSLAVDVAMPIDVLVVRDSDPILGAGGRADYLTLALMPFAASGHAGGDATAVRLLTWSATDDWTNLDSQRFRVVILDGISRITPAQARALEQHVYGGGGLLVSPGSRTRINDFNQLLYRDGAGILPAVLGRATAADGSEATTVLGIDLAHPIFSFLRGLPDPIPTATIGRYFQATPRPPDGQVLAGYASGQPMLVAGNFGRGKVLLMTTPLEEDWSTLPLTNFYLPMVQSMVRFLDARPSRNLAPGEAIIAQFDSGEEPVATVTAPDGARRDVPLQSAGDAFEARYAATALPGIYTVVRGLQTQHFVVMSPREESDLTPLAPERWQALSSQLGFNLVEMSRTPIASVLPDEHSTHEMWSILLAGVIALGLMELALGRAWSAGTSRTQLP
jgi:hypothetical protein